MNKSIFLIMIMLLLLPAASSFAKDDASYDKKIALVKKFINDDKGQQALGILKPILSQKVSYVLYILTAQAYAETDNPKMALAYYEAALGISKNVEEQRRAYFGMAKMHFWLGNYVHAEKIYRTILSTKLNKEDYELALAGLVKSLAYYDRPRLGYQMIPADLIFTKPEMVIAAAQAALWAGWGDIAKCILLQYQPIVAKINYKSPLGRDLQDLEWQTNLATWPNIIAPTFFYSNDSESFIVRHYTLDYTHYWNQIFQTSLGVEETIYTQRFSRKLFARGIYLTQNFRPTRDIVLKGRLEPTSNSIWYPFLWKFGADYTPNDYLHLQFQTYKEIVETFPAFDDKISDTLYSLSLFLNPLPYILFNGSFTRFNFSDHNFRNNYFLTATATPFNDFGLSVSAIEKGFSSRFTSPDYFSPHRYRAETIVLTLARKLGPTWHYYINFGKGRQFIVASPGDSAAVSPTHQFGVGINGPFSKCLSVSAYYADLFEASAFSNSSSYHYQYGGITFNILI